MWTTARSASTTRRPGWRRTCRCLSRRRRRAGLPGAEARHGRNFATRSVPLNLPLPAAVAVRRRGESCIIAAVDGAGRSGHRPQPPRHPNAVATRGWKSEQGMDMSADIDPKRLVFPGLAGPYRRGAPYAYAFMRFATGAVL